MWSSVWIWTRAFSRRETMKNTQRPYVWMFLNELCWVLRDYGYSVCIVFQRYVVYWKIMEPNHRNMYYAVALMQFHRTSKPAVISRMRLMCVASHFQIACKLYLKYTDGKKNGISSFSQPDRTAQLWSREHVLQKKCKCLQIAGFYPSRADVLCMRIVCVCVVRNTSRKAHIWCYALHN